MSSTLLVVHQSRSALHDSIRVKSIRIPPVNAGTYRIQQSGLSTDPARLHPSIIPSHTAMQNTASDTYWLSELRLDALWPGQYPTWNILAALFLLVLVGNTLMPAGKRKHDHIVHVGKSRLTTWLQWDTAPWLALDRYISTGYREVALSPLDAQSSL